MLSLIRNERIYILSFDLKRATRKLLVFNFVGGERHMANKADLVSQVAEATDLSKKDATPVVEAVFEAIQDNLSEGEKVQIIGFGTFEVRDRKARKGRNPQTGEEIEIPATKVPAFKAGKGLKDAVKENLAD